MTAPPAPTRLLHLTQPVDGGTARLVVQLTAAAVERGHEVTVGSPSDPTFAAQVTGSGARWIAVPMTRAPRLTDLSLLPAIRRLLRQNDVVHLHSSKAAALGRLAAASIPRRHRPQIVFTPHGWSFYVGGRAAALYRFWERRSAGVADVITVVSRGELRDGREVLGPRARLQLVENGVDLDEFSPEGPRAPRGDGHLLVQVGRLSRQKAQDRSIRALSRITDGTARLRLIGDGPLEAELRRLAADLDVSERVEFLGSTDPRPHLRAADVVVQPSRWEGMSLSLLEAMAARKVVVTSDCSGSEALGEPDLLIPHDDEEQAVDVLRARLDRLLADPELRASYGMAARRRAERSFDLSRVVNDYSKVWRV